MRIITGLNVPLSSTSKRLSALLINASFLLDSGILRAIGEVDPPWPCFMVADTTDFIEMSSNQIKSVLDSIQGAAKIFHAKETILWAS